MGQQQLRTLVSLLAWSAITAAVAFGWAARDAHIHHPSKSQSQFHDVIYYSATRSSGRGLTISPLAASTDHEGDNDDPRDEPQIFNGTVSILDRGPNHIVVSKPSGVLCHRSHWTGSKTAKTKKKSKTSLKEAEEVPMLQRVREAVGGQKVNLIHRLDRGASGCLLLSFQHGDADGGNATATLQERMTSGESAKSSSLYTKTYIALVRGEGLLRGRDFCSEGWFKVDRPLKNERGNKIKNATSYFRFLAGQSGSGDRPRASLVLARIETGRWHQIRKHLNGLSHPIIGDSTHGNSKTNREWKDKWGLQPERTCLHLLELDLPPSPVAPGGISVVDALPPDMVGMLRKHFSPRFLEDAKRALNEEGLSLAPETNPEIVPIRFAISR